MKKRLWITITIIITVIIFSVFIISRDNGTSQQTAKCIGENSILYVFTRNSFNSKQNRIGNKPSLFEIPKIEAIDIKDELTFKFAEIIALYNK